MVLKTTISLYSPRWGHDDTYTIELSPESMVIRMQARVSEAVWHDNVDPEWKGEPLVNIMRNDAVVPPVNINRLFEHVWMEWRDNSIGNDVAESAFHELADWINKITKSKPRSDFWSTYF